MVISKVKALRMCVEVLLKSAFRHMQVLDLGCTLLFVMVLCLQVCKTPSYDQCIGCSLGAFAVGCIKGQPFTT